MSGWGEVPAANQPNRPARRPWAGIALAGVGGVLVTVALAIVGALLVALLFWQLMANMVMVAFKGDLHWYGPSVYTAGGDLWWYVIATGAIGGAVLAAGAAILSRAGAPLRRPGHRPTA